MRKEHKKSEKMAKETITCMYWKSAYDIIALIGVNYSVHSNNQKEYMQAN